QERELVLQVTQGQVEEQAISPDERTLATGAYNSVKLWDMTTGEVRRVISGVQGLWQDAVRNRDAQGSGFAFSPDCQRFVTLHQDRKARLWNLRTGRLERTFGEGDELLYAVTFLNGGRALMTFGFDAPQTAQDRLRLERTGQTPPPARARL